jgi:hypothetical protein
MSFDFELLTKMEVLSEGPMYSTTESPFQEAGKKSQIKLTMDWNPLSAEDQHQVAVVYTNDSSMTKANGIPEEVLACGSNHIKKPTYEAYFYDEPGLYTTTYEITQTSVGGNFPHVLMFVCPCMHNDKDKCWNSAGNQDKGVLITGEVAFSNAFGYLAAEVFPLLPYFGVLTSVYFITLVIFISLGFWYRKNLNYLHVAVAVLATISTLECALFFILYLWKNLTGTATSPAPPLQWVAATTTVIKRTLGRVLLLAVALGFTVVRPTLSKVTLLSITVLSFIFAGLSVWKELAHDVIYVNNPDTPKALMNATVLAIEVVDVATLVWILAALVRTQLSLKKAHQAAKLKMYRALIVVLLTFTCIWMAFEAYRIAVMKKMLTLDWKWSWVLHTFWHNAGVAVLVTIATVWRPSPVSQDLSYWIQLENLSVDGDEDDIVTLEEDDFDLELEENDGVEKS